MRPARLLLVVALAITRPACRSMEERNAGLAGFYRLGMSRADLPSHLDHKPFASATRGGDGWSTPSRAGIDRIAREYEERQGTVVVHCDVFFVPRSGFGVWYDYVFY